MNRRRVPRVDLRMALGVALVLGSVAGGLALQRATSRTSAVLAASDDLVHGDTLRTSQLRVVEVHLESDQLATAVRASEAAAFDGGYVARAIGRGELLPRAAIRRRLPERRTYVVAVDEETVDGSLLPGDTVDVSSTYRSGGGWQSELVASGLEVAAVRHGSAPIGGGSRRLRVVVFVTPEQMLELEVARSAGTVALAHSTGLEPAGADLAVGIGDLAEGG